MSNPLGSTPQVPADPGRARTARARRLVAAMLVLAAAAVGCADPTAGAADPVAVGSGTPHAVATAQPAPPGSSAPATQAVTPTRVEQAHRAVREEFPDIYAGAYLSNREERELTIVLTGEPPARVLELLSEAPSPVQIRTDARFTLDELEEMKDLLIGALAELAPDSRSGVAISHQGNRLSAYTEAPGDVAQQALEQTGLDPAIVSWN